MNPNRKDTPAPFARTAESPPRTPRSKRISRVHKTPRDIYFESRTENARGAGGDDTTTPNNRISHDLSLAANTGRSSVVDSMLLSLNPDLPKFESPPYTFNSRFISSESPPSRGHLPSTSLDSNFSFHSPSSDSGPDSHRSTHHPRGRRSNSSNFQSLSRIDSLTTDEEKADTGRTRAYRSQRAGLGGRTLLPVSRSGRKSSKSSGSSSVDFGQMMRQSATTAVGRRSVSFDDGCRRPPYPITTSLSQPIIYNNIEAAPTPTVPSGPRSPAILPAALPQPAPTSTKKAFRYQSAKKSKAGTTKGSTGLKTGIVQDSPQTLHPASTEIRPPNPTKDHDDLLMPHQRRPSLSKENGKERPGFFRRVFMSSRNASATAHGVPPQLQSSRNSVGADSQAFIALSRPSKAGLSGDINHAPRAAVPPVLAKKSSIFFRRRKKSVSETIPAADPVPTLHPDLRPQAPMMNSSPSTSSLRELMNPYLGNSEETGKESTADQSVSAVRSTGIPIEKSTIKPVFPQSATHTTTGKSPSRGRQSEVSTSRNAASAKTETSLDDNLLQAHDKSFLHDNSSNETRLNATEPSAVDVADSMPVDEPENNDHTQNERQPSSREEHTPFNDGSIQSARPFVDFVQNSSRRKPPSTKPNRSRAASGETFSMTEATEQSASTEVTLAKRTVVAAVAPDETTPRVWLRPERSAEDLRKLAEASSPTKGADSSQDTGDRPASSRRPRVPIMIQTASEMPSTASSDPRSPDFDAALPFREDRVLAQRVFEGDENLVVKPKAAAWLGEAGPDRARARRAYMELYDWQNLNILAALRDFCGRLLLKGETQQVDRILDAFSSRWCACNPNHGFKATGKVSWSQ